LEFSNGRSEHQQSQEGPKDNPVDVAPTGFGGMMCGKGSVVYGFANQLQAVAGAILPSGLATEACRKMAQPKEEQKLWR
jgi:hypothetical protein